MAEIRKKAVTSYDLSSSHIEMIYDPASKKTEFAVGASQGGVKYEKSVPVEDNLEIVPLSPHNGIVSTGFIKLPSKVGSYKDEKQLYAKLQAFIKKYVQLPREFASICALYAMMSWQFERFHVLPYLRVIGTPGTGKSRFLEVVGNVCYQGMFAGASASTAAIFRTLNSFKGTLVFDEADFKNSEAWAEIVKILNSGYTSSFPVIRMEGTSSGNDFRTKTFNVYGPKLLASRARFWDEALESRCLTQVLTPQKVSVPIELGEEFTAEAQEIRNQLLGFKFKNLHRKIQEPSELAAIGTPRIRQILRAIAIVASWVGRKEVEVIVDFGKQLEAEFKSHQVRSIESDVLICILEILNDKNVSPGDGKVRIGAIAARYNARFYEDFNDKEEKDPMSPYTSPNYKVSPRKIGDIVARKLMLKTGRDQQGIYILPESYARARAMASSYGITNEMLLHPSDDALDNGKEF